jgi:hypothetical protein
MQCPVHPNYKGKSNTKRDCDHCKAIRTSVLKKAKERKNKGKGQQMSLTTPGFRCGLNHVLAEMGTIMLYGPQPKFFWRQGVVADNRAKEHFQKSITMLVGFSQRDNPTRGGKGIMQEIRGVLWLVFGRDFAGMKADELRAEKYEEKVDEAIERKERVDTARTELYKKSNKSLLLDMLGEDDGEEKSS